MPDQDYISSDEDEAAAEVWQPPGGVGWCHQGGGGWVSSVSFSRVFIFKLLIIMFSKMPLAGFYNAILCVIALPEGKGRDHLSCLPSPIITTCFPE